MTWEEILHSALRIIQKPSFIFLLIGCGLFSYFIDRPELIRKSLDKEAKITKYIGVTYIIGGIAIFVITKLFL